MSDEVGSDPRGGGAQHGSSSFPLPQDADDIKGEMAELYKSFSPSLPTHTHTRACTQASRNSGRAEGAARTSHRTYDDKGHEEALPSGFGSRGPHARAKLPGTAARSKLQSESARHDPSPTRHDLNRSAWNCMQRDPNSSPSPEGTTRLRSETSCTELQRDPNSLSLSLSLSLPLSPSSQNIHTYIGVYIDVPPAFSSICITLSRTCTCSAPPAIPSICTTLSRACAISRSPSRAYMHHFVPNMQCPARHPGALCPVHVQYPARLLEHMHHFVSHMRNLKRFAPVNGSSLCKTSKTDQIHGETVPGHAHARFLWTYGKMRDSCGLTYGWRIWPTRRQGR